MQAAAALERMIDTRTEIKDWLAQERTALIDALVTLTVRAERYMDAAVDAEAAGVAVPPSETLDESLREAIGMIQRLHFGEFRS